MTDTRVRPGRVEPAAGAGADVAALRGLVTRGTLSEAQADAVIVALAAARRQRGPRRWLAEVAGYVGGALILGSAAVLMATSWPELSDAARAWLLATVTVALAGAGLAVAGGPRALAGLRAGAAPARGRVVGMLFGLAAGTAAGTAGVLVTDQAGVAVAAAGLAVAAAGYALLPNAASLLAGGVFSVVLPVSIMEDLGEPGPLYTGIALLAVGVVWGLLAVAGVLAPRALALAVAATIALIGAQQPLAQEGTAGWAYALTVAVGVACFALYRGQRVGVLIAAGVVAFALGVPEAIWDLTNGTVGAAVILLAAGCTLVAASAVGLRLRRD